MFASRWLFLFAALVVSVSLTPHPGLGAERTPVTSSFIAAIGWANGTLQVELLNGRLYEYYHVPRGVYAAFLSAPSKGRYFNAYVKGRYQSRRVR